MIEFTRAKATVLAAIVMALLSSQPLAARPSTDIIRFKNGDVWTCEIKKFFQGYLYVGLDYVDGTISVDWKKIASIESSQMFVVRDSTGTAHMGTIAILKGEGNQPPSMTVRAGSSSVTTIEKSHVTSIQQTESSFWHDFNGAMSMGFNFTKSDNNTQYNLNANLNYVKKDWSASTQLQSSFSGSLSAPNDLHNDLTSYIARNINARNYVVIGLSDFLKSDEQQIELRTSLGGGLGKILKTTETTRILVLGGAVWTRERYKTEEAPTFSSADGLAGAVLEYFRFKTTSLSLTVLTYPGLSDFGRIRADGQAAIRYELIKNLYLSFGLYINFDSRPPISTNKSDYGATSSIGYSF